MSDSPIYDETVSAIAEAEALAEAEAAEQARSRSRNPAHWSYLEFVIVGAIVALGVALWLLAGMR